MSFGIGEVFTTSFQVIQQADTIDVLINEIEENNHNYRTRKTSLTILWLN